MQVLYSCLNIIRRFYLVTKPEQFPLTAWWQPRLWSDNCHFVCFNQTSLRVKWHAVHFPLFDHLIWHLPASVKKIIGCIWDMAFIGVLLWGEWCWGASWGTLGEAQSCRGKPRHRNRNPGAHVQRSAIQRGYPAKRETLVQFTNLFIRTDPTLGSHDWLKWQHWQFPVEVPYQLFIVPMVSSHFNWEASSQLRNSPCM